MINCKWFTIALRWHVLFVTVLAFCARWEQTTLDFKLLLQICEIDLFTYPTLTKCPAEIALPGCDNDNKWKRYLIWLENTLEPSNYCSIVSGDNSNCSYRLTVHPLMSSRLSSAYQFFYRRQTHKSYCEDRVPRKCLLNAPVTVDRSPATTWAATTAIIAAKDWAKTATTRVYTFTTWKNWFRIIIM